MIEMPHFIRIKADGTFFLAIRLNVDPRTVDPRDGSKVAIGDAQLAAAIAAGLLDPGAVAGGSATGQAP